MTDLPKWVVIDGTVYWRTSLRPRDDEPRAALLPQVASDEDHDGD